MTRDEFPFWFLSLQKRFFIGFTQQHIKIICHYSVTFIMWQDWRYTDFFFPSFLSREEMSKQQLLLLLCLLWDFKCSLAEPVTVNKCSCVQMTKTNSFQSHQSPGELRWIYKPSCCQRPSIRDKKKIKICISSTLEILMLESQKLRHCDWLIWLCWWDVVNLHIWKMVSVM